MASTLHVKSVNIRIPEELWITIKDIADERRQSFNKFAEEALAKAVRERRRQRFRAALEQLAEQDQDVQFAFPAQAEVVLGRRE